MTRRKVANWIGGIIAAFSFGTIVYSVFEYFHSNIDPNWKIIAIVGLTGYIGFYLISPAGANDVEVRITDSIVKIGGVIPFAKLGGRRSTDNVVIPTVKVSDVKQNANPTERTISVVGDSKTENQQAGSSTPIVPRTDYEDDGVG